MIEEASESELLADSLSTLSLSKIDRDKLHCGDGP